jgi:hypothetical protein
LAARTQSTAVVVAVAGWVYRDAALLRAAEASVVYAAAATRAAATKVNLVMGFLHMMLDAERTRLLRPSAANDGNYFITRDHRRASAWLIGSATKPEFGERRFWRQGAFGPMPMSAKCRKAASSSFAGVSAFRATHARAQSRE